MTGPIGEDRNARPSVPYLIGAALVVFGVLFGVWIALVGQADLQDNAAGLVTAGVGVVVAWFVSVRGRAVPQLRRSDMVEMIRLGPALCRQTIGVYRVAWRRAGGWALLAAFGWWPLTWGAGGGVPRGAAPSWVPSSRSRPTRSWLTSMRTVARRRSMTS